MEQPMDVDSSYNDDDCNQEEFTEIVGDLESYIRKKDSFTTSNNPFLVPRYENKGGAFTTGINIFSREEQQKMQERAKRFGLKNTENSITVNDEEDLYSSMGVFDDNENAKYVRLDVLHMRGTDEMSTQDVFDYFREYAPASIEWINDISCNVVWLDKISAARALTSRSKRIIGINDKDISTQKQNQSESTTDQLLNNDDDVSMVDQDESKCITDNSKSDKSIDLNSPNTIDIKAINFPLPPGIWRKGVDCDKSSKILLRFATSSDKKQPNSEKLSDYYKKYGNPNFGGMRGILTDSRKRMYRETKSKRKKSIKGNADGVNEAVINSKNPWGSLSEAWGAHDSIEEDPHHSNLRDHRPMQGERGGIKERLGIKPQNSGHREAVVIDDDSDKSASEYDSDDDWNKRSKVLRMRMHADDEEEKMQKKKLAQMAKRMQEKMMSGGSGGGGSDLRSRLGRANSSQVYREPIKVTVTNIPDRLREPVRLQGNDDNDGNDDDNGDDDHEEAVNVHRGVVGQQVFHNDDDEKEEGECEDDEDCEQENEEDDREDDGKEQVDATQVNHTEDEEEEEEEESDSDSDVSAKEVQGPKGSVIKVVQRAKPRVASTVWARLNHNAENSSNQERKTVRSTVSRDLRSRLGYHNPGRSPLRIEVKNDKYTRENSESE